MFPFNRGKRRCQTVKFVLPLVWPGICLLMPVSVAFLLNWRKSKGWTPSIRLTLKRGLAQFTLLNSIAVLSQDQCENGRWERRRKGKWLGASQTFLSGSSKTSCLSKSEYFCSPCQFQPIILARFHARIYKECYWIAKFWKMYVHWFMCSCSEIINHYTVTYVHALGYL